MLSLVLGLVIGSGITLLVGWYFYYRSKTDADRLEGAILRALFRDLPGEETNRAIDQHGTTQRKSTTHKLLIDTPANIKKEILENLARGSVDPMELRVLATIFGEVDRDISEIYALHNESVEFFYDRKPAEGFKKMDEVFERLEQWLKRKRRGK
jgi:hypothetical protein